MNPIKVEQYARLDNDQVVRFVTRIIDTVDTFHSEVMLSNYKSPTSQSSYTTRMHLFGNPSQYLSLDAFHNFSVKSFNFSDNFITELDSPTRAYSLDDVLKFLDH